jgi:hypothetical protein
VHRVADMDRHDVRAVVHDRQAKALEAHLEDAGVQLLAVAERLIGFQVPDAGGGSGRDGRRQRGGEDEARRIGAHRVDHPALAAI